MVEHPVTGKILREKTLDSLLATHATPSPASCVTPCSRRCNARAATCVAVWRRAVGEVLRPIGTPPFLASASPCLQGHPDLHRERMKQRRKRQQLKMLRRRQRRRRRGGRRKTEQQQRQRLQQQPKRRPCQPQKRQRMTTRILRRTKLRTRVCPTHRHPSLNRCC